MAYSREEVLAYHKGGKVGVTLPTPLKTKDDLCLAYTPGVAHAVKEIAANPDSIYDCVHQKGAFATVANGAIDRAEVTSECHAALAKLESGVVAPEIVAFEGTRSQTLDRYFDEAFVYRDHRFYTMRRE